MLQSVAGNSFNNLVSAHNLDGSYLFEFPAAATLRFVLVAAYYVTWEDLTVHEMKLLLEEDALTVAVHPSNAHFP